MAFLKTFRNKEHVTKEISKPMDYYEIYLVKEEKGITEYTPKNVNCIGYKEYIYPPHEVEDPDLDWDMSVGRPPTPEPPIYDYDEDEVDDEMGVLPPDSWGDKTDNTNPKFSVYVNGEELKHESQWYMTEEGIIKFMYRVKYKDMIIIKDTAYPGMKPATRNTYSDNALFYKFSDKIKLRYNRKYEMTVPVINNGRCEMKEYKLEFSSMFDPYFSSVKNIKHDIGKFITEIDDKNISAIIYQHSKDVYDELSKKWEEGTVDQDTVPQYAINVVRYKTDIDIVYAAYLAMAGRYGSMAKEVGNIKVEKTVNIPDLKDLLSRLKELLKPNEDNLYATNNIATFVKAKSTSYTVDRRGVIREG